MLNFDRVVRHEEGKGWYVFEPLNCGVLWVNDAETAEYLCFRLNKGLLTDGQAEYLSKRITEYAKGR